MHFTLHLTTGCNLACTYCYAPRCQREDMPTEVLERAIDLAATLDPRNAGIVFFGGEPLLRRDLVEHALARCRGLASRGRSRFHYKITTNGTLLDPGFIAAATRDRLHIALSLDGPAPVHDRHRHDADGRSTFARIAPVIPRLLRDQPYAAVLMVVTPQTVSRYARSVEWLLAQGFRYIVASLHYAGEWTETAVARLGREYERLADLYQRLTARGEKFYFSPFEKKLAAHIQGPEAVCRRCHFGLRQVSVAPNGDIYPCVQFVQDGHRQSAFVIGNVWTGIDRGAQARLFAQSQREPPECAGCAVASRCEHLCSCLNWQTTGAIDRVAPVLCVTERTLIPLVDRLGERLWQKRAPLFVQKHYNSMYPVISGLEDLAS